jgi:hypothetical protein
MWFRNKQEPQSILSPELRAEIQREIEREGRAAVTGVEFVARNLAEFEKLNPSEEQFSVYCECMSRACELTPHQRRLMIKHLGEFLEAALHRR